MTLAGPFAGTGNQTKDNLIHLKEGQIVGEWRDSTYGKSEWMTLYRFHY